jgi:hypothetical protein
MVGVRTRNLFPELLTFQLLRNTRYSICFLLQAHNRTPHEHTYQSAQPFE